MERVWLNHYEPGVPHDIPEPKETLPLLLDIAAQKYPNNTATVFMGGRLTYQELNALADRFAAVLSSMGLGLGSRLAIHLPNSPQFVYCYYGALRAGCTVIPCNPLYVERELEYQLKDAGAEVIVTLSRFYPMVRRIKEKLKFKSIIATNIKEHFAGHMRLLYTLAKEKKEGDRVNVLQGDFWLQDLMSKNASSPVPRPEFPTETEACFLYTGGTTGVSKGAVLTHRNLVANVYQCKAWLPDAQEGKEVTLSVLPFFHSYGMTASMNFPIYSCGTMVLLPRFDLQMVLKLIDKEKPSLFPGVPTIYVAINNYPEIQRHNLGHIRVCLSGAAALPVEVQSTFEKLTSGKLVEAYGLSETSPAALINPVNGTRKAGSIGVPIPSTYARVVDADDPTKEMPVGESGELAIKGPQVMKGYHNMPEQNKEAIVDGWFRTGDMATMDEDGFFYIVDRKKDMIISGGFNIYPREIEEVLYGHEKISEAAVVGIPDEYKGEAVKAFIVLKEGQTLTEQEVIDYCTKNLTKYKVPKKVEFRSELPKTMIGKILRRVLQEEEKAKMAKE